MKISSMLRNNSGSYLHLYYNIPLLKSNPQMTKHYANQGMFGIMIWYIIMFDGLSFKQSSAFFGMANNSNYIFTIFEDVCPPGPSFNA